MFSQSPASVYPQDTIGDQSNMSAFIKDLRKVHEAVLSKAAKRAIKLKPMLKIFTQLKEGNTPSQIIETAANGGFDLIVVGHMGESEIKEFLLGSTSERVAHQARCAVLIVK
jgi:nucleotide-binding universal stress UspA family protein